MAMRELVTGGAACAVPGQSSSSNPFGALANALIGSSSKQERLKEIPSSTPTASEPQFYPDGHGHLQQLPGSELDQPFMQPRTQSSEFLRNFNSVDGNRLLGNAWDEVQSSQPEPMHMPQHDRIYDMRPQLQTTLDGPPQRVLSSFLHSFVESSRGGMPFRPTPLPVLGLSAGDKQCIRDRTSIMARHFFADKSEDFINGQVNALLSSLDIDSDVNSKGPLPARFRELDDYWNESQAITKPGAHAVQGWVTEFSQHRLDHGDPNAWAHSFERQHGANGWASEFEQEQSQLMSADHMRGVNMASLAAMEQTRMLANTLAQNEEPKFQKSRFLQFVSKMNRGELIIDDNQVKPATSYGDWASEYQQQYNAGPSWADEYARGELSHGPNQWANEFKSEQEQHGSVDDQWVNQFTKLHVDDWAEDFGNQVGEGLLGDSSADSWANAYNEYMNEQAATKQRNDAARGVYVFSDMNPYVGHPNPLKVGQEMFHKGLLSEAVLALEAEVLKNPDNAEGWLNYTTHAHDGGQMAIKDHASPLLFFFFFLAISSLSTTFADSVHGCGGFVEARSSLIKARKPTDAKLDFSHITVELRTVDGFLKDSTQCAPNGYYFIPVYDKGSFLIKINGPEGWSWNPDKVPVIVDDSGCNGSEDINFRFTGFSLSGRVVGAVGGGSCSVQNGGPPNIELELLSDTGGVVSSVITSPGGSYLFKNIIPGKYELRALHPDLKVEIRGSTKVNLGFGNDVVDDIFFVPGYDIRGFVVSQGNPILGVHFYLYSDDVLEVDCPQGSGTSSGTRKALCHAVSDAHGMFMFKSIPCGTYELIPYYKGENTVFDVSPPVMSVTVEHQHVTVPQKFQVTGFSVGGRVVDGNDEGIEGVKIKVDGDERSITDKQGYYKLDQITSNRYAIEATKEHYKFSSLKDYLVLPNMASVMDIKAVSYDVCGVVQMVSAGYKAKVALTRGPENVKPQVKQTDGSGNFCFEVLPGEYRLSAISATPDSASGLMFLPSYIDVAVKGPLLNVKFSQALVNVRGTVTCKEKCGTSVSVILVGLAGTRNEEKRTINLTDESSDFHFENVIPGKYRFEVKHNSEEPTAVEDNWCWEKSSIDVDVGVEDVKGIEFVQKGYWLNVVSTHDVDAFMIQPDGSSINLKIKKGSQNVRVEYPGVHELHFVNSCIFFGSSSIRTDTLNPLPVYLKGEKYLVKGQISVSSSSFEGVSELPENFIVDILNAGGSIIDETTARLTSSGNDQSAVVYEYSAWANHGERLTFVPKDPRTDETRKILFYPRQHHVLITNDGCQASIPPFSGRLGLYITGSVSPPISEVHIKILAAGDSHIAQLKDGEIVLETTTGMDGAFVGGPLYDEITYHVEASKPGYHLKQVGPHSFSCQKLGQISVNIHSKDDAKETIPSVLLSLSGDDGYRNNLVSGAGGAFLFNNLFPGTFYLRPLLKEFAFSPPALAIDLGSGESKEAIFLATRVAYSAMGVVTLLSGQPKEGVLVEARSESKGYYGETVTDSSGSYRLRGLLPDTTYVIKVVKRDGLGSAKIERASPESVPIKVGHEDIKGLDFLVFEQPDTTVISCHVEGKRIEELHPHLMVEIKSSSDLSMESVFPLPLSNFFQVKDLPKGKHLLQLRSSLPSSSHNFESEVIEVDLEQNTRIHVGPLRYVFEEDHHKQELTPAPVFPLIVGVSVIALFATIPSLKDLYQSTVGIPTPGFTTTAKKEVRKTVLRKKTY